MKMYERKKWKILRKNVEKVDEKQLIVNSLYLIQIRRIKSRINLF